MLRQQGVFHYIDKVVAFIHNVQNEFIVEGFDGIVKGQSKDLGVGEDSTNYFKCALNFIVRQTVAKKDHVHRRVDTNRMNQISDRKDSPTSKSRGVQLGKMIVHERSIAPKHQNLFVMVTLDSRFPDRGGRYMAKDWRPLTLRHANFGDIIEMNDRGAGLYAQGPKED